ncbi:MAG TPA: hypothetical protein VGU90_00605 [Terriglobales bacterium]|nr:hypothetical protein [Terriglobales bacterium]
MKTTVRFLMLALITVAMPQLFRAQRGMMMQPPTIAGVFNPVVGSGASYEMVKGDNGEKTVFDMAVVEKDSSGGYWIEYGVQNAKSNGTVYLKNLTARQGDDIVTQRTIIQMPGRPPMDLSSMMSMKAMQSEKSKADFRTNAQNMGTESVTTPAGTFSCEHWRDTKDGTDVWLSDKVVPWRLVKMTGTTIQ